MTDRWSVQCEEVRDLVPELAMGVAPGDERAAALAHVATCAECRARLEEAARLVDELMLLAPEHEPPVGFETRLLAAMENQAPVQRRRRMTWLAAAAAAVVLVALGASAVTRWAVSDDLEVADQYRQTLDIADGSYLRAADLTASSGSETGHVFAYQGEPSWVFMTIEGAPSGTYEVRVVTADGRAEDVGECWVRDGRGSWGRSVDLPIRALDRVEMTSHDGTTLTAEFRSTGPG